MALSQATLKGNYFTKDGHAFLPVGAHWVPAVAALQWPTQWDPASIEEDFKTMQSLGYNAVRFDLFWAWFEPRPGDYNPAAFRQLDFLIELAHRYAIYLHPTLFIGGEVGEAYWDVPWRHGRHPHADPEMLRLQTNHAAEFARRYAGEPAILAWDLTDEPPYWIALDQTTDAMAINWTRLISGAIRRYDPDHAICVGTSMEDLGHGPFRPDTIKDEVNFFTAHPYSIYSAGLFPDAMLSARGTYCGTFQTLLSSGAGRPVMIHELGASSAQYTPENVARFDRTTMYSTLGMGANGYLLWCYTDAAPKIYHKAPYLRAPHETQFGMTTWDRKTRPQGEIFKQFCAVVGQMDLDGLAPAQPEAAILVPYEWQKPAGDFSKMGLAGSEAIPYASVSDGGVVTGSAANRHGEENGWLTGSWLNTLILARQAGLKPAFVREYEFNGAQPLALLPAPLTSTDHVLAHVHTVFWQTAKEYVQQGGALYASLCADAAIPEMEELFGARLADHAPVSEVTITLQRAFGGLQPGETFSFHPAGSGYAQWPAVIELAGAEVIAVDQDGRPALVSYENGKGKTLLCTYPIEVYLAQEPGAFDRPNPAYRLYRALAQWAGVQPRVDSGHPAVEVGRIENDVRGYAVFTNHSAQDVDLTARVALDGASAALLLPQGPQALQGQTDTWKVTVPAWDGVIVEWKK